VSGRGGQREVTMISRSVEISIAGGVSETEDSLTTWISFFSLVFFVSSYNLFIKLRS